MKLCHRGVRDFFLVGIILALVASSVFATSSKTTEASCPVCDHKFSAKILMSSNNLGGCDSDLCPHAMGSSPLQISIWGCPSCHFCGYSNEFEHEFPAEKKEELKKWLTQQATVTFKSKNNSFDAIPSYKRYEIAAGLSIRNKATPMETGLLYLRAAWCCRNLGVIYESEDLQLSSQLSEEDCPTFFTALKEVSLKIKPSRNRAENFLRILEELASSFAELKIPQAELASSCLTLGRFLRSTGENKQALVWLDKSLDANPLFRAEIDAIKLSIKVEHEYQLKAIPWLEKAINQPGLHVYQMQELIIMLAESQRRTGNNEEAAKSYLKLFDLDDVSIFALEMARKGLEKAGCSQLFPHEKMADIEEKQIQSALESLKEGMKGEDSARYLRSIGKRDRIFPELLKGINSNDEILQNNCLRAMCDDTPEAVAVQIDLFRRGKFVAQILKNFRVLSTPIPIEPLLEVFAREEPLNLPDNLIEIIAACGSDAGREALLARADREFTPENIQEITSNVPSSYYETGYYRKLITSLSSCDDLRAISVLQRVIDHAHVNGFGFGYDLVADAGTAIEFIINRYLGFSVIIKRDREPQYNRPDKNNWGNPFAVAKTNLRNWLEKNDKKSLQEIINVGFSEAGYRVLPVSDPDCLPELIAGLSDRFTQVRYHCYKELERRTGVSYKPLIGRDPKAYWIDYKHIVWFYTEWYKKNRESLIFNEAKGSFDRKNR